MAFNEKYVTVNGGGLHDGSSEANAWTLDEAYANMSSGDRLNIKAGTYVLTQHLRYWPTSSVSSPSGYRGYKAAIGDLDSKPTSQLVDGTDRPLIQTTNSSYFWQTFEQNALYENLTFKSTTSRPAIYTQGSRTTYNRCKFIASASGAPASAPLIATGTTGEYIAFIFCHFDGNNCGTYQNTNTSLQFSGCLIENFDYISAARFLQVNNSIVRNMSSGGLKVSGFGWTNFNSNTFYNISGNAVEVTASTFPTTGASVLWNNVFHTITGDAIKSFGNYFDFFADNNLFYNITGSNYTNTFNLNRNAISEASDPFVDAAGQDYSLVSSSGGYGKAQPNPFEGLAADSRRDLGAIQHADPSGGGGAVLHPLRSN